MLFLWHISGDRGREVGTPEIYRRGIPSSLLVPQPPPHGVALRHDSLPGGVQPCNPAVVGAESIRLTISAMQKTAR